MRTRLVLLLTIAAGLVAASPAWAGFPSSINAAVPAGGFASITSPTLPPAAKSLNVDVQPVGEDPAFAKLRAALASIPKNKRLVRCVVSSGLFTLPEPGEVTYGSDLLGVQVIALRICIEIMREVNASGRRAVAAASGLCHQAVVQAPVQLKRSGSKYRATITGPVKRASAGTAPYRLGCARKGRGYTLSVRARKGTLRQALGASSLQLALVSPRDASGSAAARVTFRR